ncbi:MAG: DNA translocase FtsK 4TM domain-containing protein [Planctomycetes bacterium]|nr:DNA translocase FtsK 4TM domain-containing protein [Planctomycetota bacterium]
MAKKTKTTSVLNTQVEPHTAVRFIGWLVLAAAWVMIVLALASYDPADWPGHAIAPHNANPANWIGPVGAVIAHQAYLMVGPGIWIFMAGWLAVLASAAMKKPITQFSLRLVGVVLMTVIGSAIVGLSMPAVMGRPEGSGGLIALWVNSELTSRFHTMGTLIILGLFFVVAAVLAADHIVMAIPNQLVRAYRAMPRVNVPKPVLVGRFPGLSGWTRREDTGTGAAADARRGGVDVEELDDDGPVDEDAVRPVARHISPDEHFVKPGDDTTNMEVTAELDEDDDDADTAAASSEDDANDEEGAAADAPGAYVAEKRQFDPDALRAKIKAMPINLAPRAPGKTLPAREIDLSGYRFPGVDVLIEPESNFTEEMERVVRDQAIQLEEALRQYNIDGEVVGIDSGPVITLYEVRLAAGTKVSVLSAVSSDLARSLKSHNIRIVPNMVGKDTVGIEVPNILKEKVRLKELMGANNDVVSKMGLPMFLGKDASGNPLIEDLAKMPHMLIAGTTGSGKSVCMNSIIMSFLLTKRPDELKMVLVDPKMVEMSQFKDIPHLMCPVVTEMSKAAAILEWAVTKMDERYELLAEAGVRDVSSYNSLSWEEIKERFNPANEDEEARIPKKLYYMVFVIDELADLMITNKEVEGFIVRIAQKARAVGMHLILATQRPQANVVTGLIKSNMPCRVSFKVASGMDSRIVLDQKGAELLLGQGDMLFLSPRSSKLTRAQGTLVDDMEIRRTVKFLKEIAEQNFEPQLVQLKGPGGGDVDQEAARDPLFADAVGVVLQTKRGSVSLLQRRLTIGYSRASRLIEAMAMAGILGEYKGSQAREVAITLEEWEAMKEQMARDAASEPTLASGGVADFEKNGGNNPDWANEGDDDDVPDEIDGEFRQ